jgi:hypothetical protein
MIPDHEDVTLSGGPFDGLVWPVHPDSEDVALDMLHVTRFALEEELEEEFEKRAMGDELSMNRSDDEQAEYLMDNVICKWDEYAEVAPERCAPLYRREGGRFVFQRYLTEEEYLQRQDPGPPSPSSPD